MDVLIGGIGSVAAALVRMIRSFHGIVTDLVLLAVIPAVIPSIRVRSDIVRDPVPNPGWKPLLLSTHQVSSYKGLVQVLDYIASLSNHTHPIVDILVDEKIQKKSEVVVLRQNAAVELAPKTEEDSRLVRLLASL